MRSVLEGKKIGFIGAGNMTQAIVGSLLKKQLVNPSHIFITNRTEKKLDRVCSELGVNGLKNNEDLIDQCDVVVIAVKPQDLVDAIEPISSSFHSGHLVISLAAGVSLDRLKKTIGKEASIVRVMPNTPVSTGFGVIGYCSDVEDDPSDLVVEALFEPSSLVFKVSEDDEFDALMVATSSGVGFVFELMIYWQEWLEEYGFDKEQARQMTVQTFLGSSILAQQNENTQLSELQNKVTSKKGVTAAGLDSMRELEIERLMRYSFEKAELRGRELSNQADKT